MEVEFKADVLELLLYFDQIGVTSRRLAFLWSRFWVVVGVGIGDGFTDEEGTTAGS